MTIIYNKEEIEIDETKIKNVKALVKHLDLIPSTILILKNNQIVDMQERFKAEDKVEVLRVVSGG